LNSVDKSILREEVTKCRLSPSPILLQMEKRNLIGNQIFIV